MASLLDHEFVISIYATTKTDTVQTKQILPVTYRIRKQSSFIGRSESVQSAHFGLVLCDPTFPLISFV